MTNSFFRRSPVGKLFLLIILLSSWYQGKSQNTTDLTDAEVASVAVTANQIDIEYAQIARKKSKNQEVLNFAATMEKDHQAVIKKAVDLVTRLKVSPKDNPLTRQLIKGSEKTKRKLNGEKASQFDKTYIDNEVAYHKAVISVVETVLIPQTENAEVKQLLNDVLPALRTHLSHAEMVQKMISK